MHINENTPRMRKCKKCLKTCSIGEVNNGLYFKKTSQYLSACSGIFTILGLLLIFALSINVFVQISKKDQVTTVNNLIDSSVNNVIKLNEKVEEFRNKSMLSFKVKAYSFESLMYEPIACENVDLSVFYNVPTTKENSRIPVITICNEVNGALNYTIELKH